MNDKELRCVAEASVEATRYGLEPAGPGWYVVNVGEAAGWSNETFGGGVAFESAHNRFEQYGVNLHVVQPGHPTCRYHCEGDQESFLVLRGECLLIVDEQERSLRPGDFFHCPPGTRHVIVGAGDGPCAILMIGGRAHRRSAHYPYSEVAARHGASAAVDTGDPTVAYASDPPVRPARADLGWVFGS